ncbi:MAG: SUMF1/EgtB/PvdO family nonheme iron enzyme [Bacteroidales bacterium]|nr:SUMF1/EgtB/PvdO family nonheme iron enzyme [Bacteroidales bacterium]
MVESNSLLKVGTLLNHDKYRIERYLASGGFGNTYEGVNVTLGKKCAIKEFFLKGIAIREDQTSKVHVAITDNKRAFNSQKEKFTKEAHRLSCLDNNHIVKVFDLFEENGTVYYVMDYIEGESLRDVQKRTGRPFSEQEVLSILSQMLDALNTIHQHGLLHMDIKPANIMIDQSGKCTLIDFGASKQSAVSDGATTSSTMAYTPGYAPVEQIGGSSDRWGPWTDFYALGATLYNLLTNENPVNLDIEEDGEAAFKFPPAVSSSTRLLIQWLMSPKRKDRPQNVREIKDCLKEKKTNAEESLIVEGGYNLITQKVADSTKYVAEVEATAIDEPSKGEETPIESDGKNTIYVSVASENDNDVIDKSDDSSHNNNDKAKKKKRIVGRWEDFVLLSILLMVGIVFLVKKMDSDQENDTQIEQTSIFSKNENPTQNLTFTVDGVSFTMVYVPGGTFTMGATSEVSDAESFEKPTHSVTLSSYYIGQTEVTQALWTAVMGSNPSEFRDDRRPVENVSWNDCQTFISLLNAKTGKNFRLPSEAEWEYAARGGHSGGSEYAGSNNVNSVAWYADNSDGETHNVATKSPNSLGIYDMSGNVCEWCQDWVDVYSTSSQTNPKGPSSGVFHVWRGGGWSFNAWNCRVSYRDGLTPSDSYYGLGLRLAF